MYFFPEIVHIASGAYPASDSMDMGVFPLGDKAAGASS